LHVIARERERSSNDLIRLWDYWMRRFHPKSALADFGGH